MCLTIGLCVNALPARAHGTNALNERLLRLVNQVRRHGHRCGGKWRPAVQELTLAGELIDAAERHADDMAAHRYLEHLARDGSTPSQRVARTGYRSRLTGENIAFAPTSVHEVFDGWMASKGHCENIMDPRFRTTGAAVAISRARGDPHYWVQLLAWPH
jgi:uncharacterized protein YkwD